MLIRFIHTRSGGSESLELIEAEELVRLRLYCRFGGLAPGILRFEVLSQLISIEANGRLLVGTAMADTPTEIHVAFDGSLSADFNLRSSGLSIRFGAAVNEIQFSRDALDKPVLFADEAMEQQARLACERELEGVARDAGIEARVRLLVRERLGRPITLEQVADTLEISVRTLKRRLQESGATFQQIKDEERYHRAMFLLETTQMNQEGLAEMLGFSDASNFAKAFRSWAGMTPAEFRIRMQTER
jgi:AraC-like DNA-binding protein